MDTKYLVPTLSALLVITAFVAGFALLKDSFFYPYKYYLVNIERLAGDATVTDAALLAFAKPMKHYSGNPEERGALHQAFSDTQTSVSDTALLLAQNNDGIRAAQIGGEGIFTNTDDGVQNPLRTVWPFEEFYCGYEEVVVALDLSDGSRMLFGPAEVVKTSNENVLLQHNLSSLFGTSDSVFSAYIQPVRWVPGRDLTPGAP